MIGKNMEIDIPMRLPTRKARGNNWTFRGKSTKGDDGYMVLTVVSETNSPIPNCFSIVSGYF